MTTIFTIASLLPALASGRPVEHSAGVFVPLVSDRPAPPAAVLLEEALESRETVVRELDSAHMNRIIVEHGGASPLLILDGDMMVGGFQDRAFDASVVVEPRSRLELPVSCIERGRWDDGPPPPSRRGVDYTLPWYVPALATLRAAAHVMPPSPRANKLRRVAQASVGGRIETGHQEALWRAVDEYIVLTGVRSRTAALMAAALHAAAHEPPIDLPLPDDALGLALVRNGDLTLIDVFGCPDLFRRALPKLLRGAVAQGEARPTSTAFALATVSSILRSLECSLAFAGSTCGAGRLYHAVTHDLSFGAVNAADRLYHATIVAHG